MEITKEIQELLGDKYHEGMTSDEVLTALSEMSLANLSTGEYVSKNKYNSAVIESSKKTAELQKQLDAKLSEDEKEKKAQEERENLIKAQGEELRKIKRENIFTKKGFSDMLDLIPDDMSTESAEQVVSMLSRLDQKHKDELEKAKLDAFKSPEGGKAAEETTIDKMDLAAQMKFKKEHPEEYERQLKKLKNKKE